ncbi:transmembrane protein 132A-like, partial [Acipenser ruthenus]|uniref:transmembrane protein 132A-like n=1 Tax=Acipenser ruthenus TaxID=7906 RepID=UPI0027422A3E
LDQEVLGNSSQRSHSQSLLLLHAPGEKQLPRGPGFIRTFHCKAEPERPTEAAAARKQSSITASPPLGTAPPACLETVLQPSQNELHYTGAVALRSGGAPGPDSGEEEEEEELRLDPNVVIRSPKGPLKLGQPIKVGVLLRENCTAELVVIRVKLKKGLSVESVSPSLASDDWTVSVEETLGSKHHTTLADHPQSSTIAHTQRSSRVIVFMFMFPSVLFWEPARLSLQSDNFTGPAVTRRISWQVEYPGQNPLWGSEGGAALTRITLTHRALLGIVPVTQTPSLVNTAILTGLRVSLPVTVLAVEHDGTVYDVTHYVTCRSTNEDIVKVSSDCSSVFVDGFESSQGGLGVRVEFQLESLAGALLLSVWVPRLPLTLQLSDAQLSQIRGWRVHSNTDCSPQYQRSTVQVLAQFAAIPLDPEGQLTFMLGSPDWFVDVTELVRDWLRTTEPRIATLSPEGILIGREPGVTSLQVVSSLWDTVIGQREVTVSSDKVTLGDLSVQLISGLTLSIKPSAGLHGVVTATASAQQQLHTYRQEAVLSIWLQFSDDTTVPLETFDPGTYSLRLLSLAEGVVTLETVATETDRSDGGKPLPLVVARGDGGGPLIRAELSDTGCHRLKKQQQQPIRKKTGVLAGGSGWVRVNFDLRRRGEGDSGEGEDYFGERRKVWRGERRQEEEEEGEEDSLGDQRKVLREEGASVDEASSEDQPGFLEWEPTGGRGAPGGRRLTELEIGMYALLAAFCLAILAFLANCVLLILKSRRKGGAGGGGEDSGKSRHNWLWLGTDLEELGRQADLAANLSQRRKERGGSEGPYPTAEPGPGVAHASGTRLVFPSAAHDDHVTPEVEELASQEPLGAGGRVRFAPREDPALAASEEDVEWLCRDMGLSRRSEMESYMEGIRRDSERDS